MTGDRVEAAAKALWAAGEAAFVNRGKRLLWDSPAVAEETREEWRREMEVALAAADECDRVAGVVRLDTRDEALVDRLARVLCDVDQSEIEPERRETMEQTGSGDDFRDMVRALFAVLAAGAQPPPEGEQR